MNGAKKQFSFWLSTDTHKWGNRVKEELPNSESRRNISLLYINPSGLSSPFKFIKLSYSTSWKTVSRKYQYILNSHLPRFHRKHFSVQCHCFVLWPRLSHARTHPADHDVPPPSSVSPLAPRIEITSPSVLPEPGHAKPMGALLSKAPPQLLTLINLMWRSVEGTVWKSSQCRDPVPCCWTEGELGKLGEGGWEREPGRKKERGVKRE